MINTFQKVVNKNDAFCQRSGISKYKSNGNFINKMAIKIDGLISLKADWSQQKTQLQKCKVGQQKFHTEAQRSNRENIIQI